MGSKDQLKIAHYDWMEEAIEYFLYVTIGKNITILHSKYQNAICLHDSVKENEWKGLNKLIVSQDELIQEL